MKTAEIREAFLKYFEDNGHSRQPSSGLIPAGDPTLLFTNAGMVQFKDSFLGTENRGYSRATTCQKCLRISGKHNDLENVGRTARHHTFFEMLGNFSFGDYFKKEAICFAWKFLTEDLGLPKDRLWVTVYEDDDEAADLWSENTDVFEGRVLRYGEKDNFWAMGDTGPCGPCSEIFYYLGDNVPGQSEEEFRSTDTLYIEVWNLVFMQYNRDVSGALTPLPKPSVDTGMGLERVAAVKQGVSANYDIDLLRDLISETERLSGKAYDGADYSPREDEQYAIDVAHRVAADHVRASAFLISEGILPSSDGRGYVLRRLIRRACRHGRVLGFNKPFLFELASTVVAKMGGAYSELSGAATKIEKVIKGEEERFLQTLDTGMALLEKEVAKLKESSSKIFPGTTAFALHDTYGFPLDLTEDIVDGHGLSVDKDGFSVAMEEQRERSRSARANETELVLRRAVKQSKTTFVGYEFDEYESEVEGIYNADGELKSAAEGEEVAVVVKETPFYGESGGQVGDTGTISSNNASLEVVDTQKVGDTYVHICRVADGSVAVGDKVRLSIEGERRSRLRAHHSATHLLHLALRDVLGDHIKQAGSRVSDRTLRFDFNHFEQITDAQLREIETIANQIARENHEVVTELLPIEEAKNSGAVALFGEKYGETVRVVEIGPRSKEFCGGTHVERSGDIGLISLVSEGGISAGVRRIEAVAGAAAFQQHEQQKESLKDVARLLKTGEKDVVDRLKRVLEQQRELEQKVTKLEQSVSTAKGGSITEAAETTADGRKVVATIIDGSNPKQLREMADDLRGRLGSACIALGSVQGDKAILLAAVSNDLTDRYHAGNIIKELASVIGCRGGGKPDLAQAGGGDPTKLSAAMDKFRELVQ